MTIEEELACVARARAGEREAMSVLWESITPKLYGYLLNVVRDSRLADDFLQETWLKAITNLPRFQARGVRFSAWLFAIARNVCREHWRKSLREVPLDLSEEKLSNHVTNHKSTEEKLLVEMMMRKFSEEDRDILRLRFIADLSYKEIACVMEISTVAARVRVHRALGRARAILTQTQ